MKKARVRSVRMWEVAFPEGGRALFPTRKAARLYSDLVNSNLTDDETKWNDLRSLGGYEPEGG